MPMSIFPHFGHRFLTDQTADAGQPMSERTAWALCAQMGWWSSFAKTRRGKGRPGPPVHDDRVQRDFRTHDLDRVWLTDITEHPTSEGKLYLCAVKDVCSNRIVGDSINERMTSNLAVAAISNAVTRRRADGHAPAGCIVHSDRGSQFRSRAFVTTARPAPARGIDGSCRCCRRQRSKGGIVRALAKQRPQHSPLDQPRRVTDGDHHLD